MEGRRYKAKVLLGMFFRCPQLWPLTTLYSRFLSQKLGRQGSSLCRLTGKHFRPQACSSPPTNLPLSYTWITGFVIGGLGVVSAMHNLVFLLQSVHLLSWHRCTRFYLSIPCILSRDAGGESSTWIRMCELLECTKQVSTIQLNYLPKKSM